ncbi:MAG: hypothetical protein RR193_05170, partial [Christensenellaceae bacterium]
IDKAVLHCPHIKTTSLDLFFWVIAVCNMVFRVCSRWRIVFRAGFPFSLDSRQESPIKRILFMQDNDVLCELVRQKRRMSKVYIMCCHKIYSEQFGAY